MEKNEDLLGKNSSRKKEKRNAWEEHRASRPQRPDEYHEAFILRGEAL